ncbi:histidine kinase [candidate division KSB1 bacterium]|nr:histidine kinase [candidate division KSB1 bacterium]
MQDGKTIAQRLLRWSLLFACWTFLGLFSASQIYIRYAYNSDTSPTWRQALSVAMPDWYAWGMLSPFIFWFARRFPLERKKRGRRLFIHFFAGVFFSFSKMVLEYMVLWRMIGLPMREVSPVALQQNLLIYAAIVGIIYAFDYYGKYREHEVKASQLQAQLAQAQLQALKMQLHPHFLFNTLHAISTLIHKDVEAADRMIARLSDLLRLSLENLGVQEVTLKHELEFLERYLEIEQIRFGDRLTVRMNIEPEALDGMVPNFILQPIVENAIRHGIAPRAAHGHIEIHAKRENGQLQLEVHDDGPGLPESKRETLKEGVGLANTQARLQQLYAAAHRFELFNAEAGGLVVRLSIPLRMANDGINDVADTEHPLLKEPLRTRAL